MYVYIYMYIYIYDRPTFHFGLITHAITFPNSEVLALMEMVVWLKQPISQITSMQLLFIFTPMIY